MALLDIDIGDVFECCSGDHDGVQHLILLVYLRTFSKELSKLKCGAEVC